MQVLFCKYTFECISNSLVFYLKNSIYLTEIKKENSNNFFLIILNENLLYLKIFPTSSSEGYTESRKVLMHVLETD